MKHVSEMTEAQMDQMTRECELAAIDFVKKNGFSGLSENNRFNFYRAIQEAIKTEWIKAKG